MRNYKPKKVGIAHPQSILVEAKKKCESLSRLSKNSTINRSLLSHKTLAMPTSSHSASFITMFSREDSSVSSSSFKC